MKTFGGPTFTIPEIESKAGTIYTVINAEATISGVVIAYTRNAEGDKVGRSRRAKRLCFQSSWMLSSTTSSPKDVD